MNPRNRTSDRLVVILEGRAVGLVERTVKGLRLRFDDPYLDDESATPLSLAMPRQVSSHGDQVLSAWLWGLLPDNADVLSRWGRALGVSVTSPFPLLATQIGHDCAGAVQFCAPEALNQLLDRPGSIEPLTEADVAARLRTLGSDTSAWLGPETTGQFSLGGAQAKTALHHDGNGWSQPTGATPTTHILKPAIAGLKDHDVNEHLCLTAARHCGIRAAASAMVAFEDQTAISLERYDRRRDSGSVVRLHQEDLCQALGLPPSRKYQSDGGPSPTDVVRLLRSAMPPGPADDAVWRFLDALAFNWLIAGTDAHAKNYSLVHSGNQTRLAPLYDLASSLPYDTTGGRKLKLAMRLGAEYRLLPTDRPTTWRRVASELDLPADKAVGRVARMADAISDAFAEAAREVESTLHSDLPGRLVDAVAARAQRCSDVLS